MLPFAWRCDVRLGVSADCLDMKECLDYGIRIAVRNMGFKAAIGGPIIETTTDV